MRKQILVAVTAFVLGAGVMAGVNRPAAAQSSEAHPDLVRLVNLFYQALTIVQRRYVAPVNSPVLIQAAMKGMVASLDPHSDYLNRAAFDQVTAPSSVGLEVTSVNGSVRVVSPIPGGPAAKAGVEGGDYILAIDSRTLMLQPLDSVVRALHGPAGSTVVLTIKRPRLEKSFDVSLVRDIVQPVTAKGHMEGDVGYLRVSALDEHTTDQAQAAIKALQAANPRMKGLVLDLRGNPGGALDQVISVSSLFLNGGEVMSQHGRKPEDVERYDARPDGDMLHGLPMALLINGGTAAGAEIIAGALQDRHRATIVGLTSFGSGTIQTLIPLQNYASGAIKLTTARVLTPSGRSLQAVGVKPDIEVAASDVEAKRAADPAFAFSEANLHSAFNGEAAQTRLSSLHPIAGPPPGFDPKGDYQLLRAEQAIGAARAAVASR